MIPSVMVRTGDRPCPVYLGAGALAEVGPLVRRVVEADRVVLLADPRAAELHGAALDRSFRRAGVRVRARISIPRGEGAKSLGRARLAYRALVDAGADRWTPVVAFGGGVTGDLAGFVASTFLRGMPLVQVPTTLVAQVDSSVGGKTGVNFAGAKNLIGTFHQPSLVVADPEVLATLAPRDYRSGLAEVVKIAVTLRPDLMERMERRTEDVIERRPDLLVAAVRACVEAKAEVVGRDERDRDVRGILNYGHTIGHAVEAASGGRLRHGEAVAIGMGAAAWIGGRMGVTHPEVERRQGALLSRLGLPASVPLEPPLVLRNLKLDKKVRDRRVRFVLTLHMGGASVWPHIPERLLREAVRRVLG